MDPNQYRYDGGDLFGDFCDVGVDEVEGLSTWVGRVGDQELPRGHGSVPGDHYVAARQILFKLWPDVTTLAEAEAAVAWILETFAVRGADATLEFARRGQPDRYVNCRPVAVSNPETAIASLDPVIGVLLTAADPRIYSVEEHQEIVPLYTPSGGALNYPVTNYPKNWSAGAVAEQVAHNAGSADAHPLVRFYGPIVGTVTGVELTNLTTGDTLEITATVATGQILTYDGHADATKNGDLVVHLDGTTRYADWEQPRTTFRLQPGDNVLRFTVTGTSTDAECLVTWHDTWLP